MFLISGFWPDMKKTIFVRKKQFLSKKQCFFAKKTQNEKNCFFANPTYDTPLVRSKRKGMVYTVIDRRQPGSSRKPLANTAQALRRYR